MTDGISDECNRSDHYACDRCPRCTCHGKPARAEAAAVETAMRAATWHPGQDEV